MDWQKLENWKMSSVSEHIGTQESLCTDGKTVEWCNPPREPSSSISVLSQTKYMHTLWCNHFGPKCMFQKKFSYMPIRGHAQKCSSKFYLWYQQAGSNLAVYHWGNIQGKCEGRLCLAWAGKNNGLDVYTAIWIDFKNTSLDEKSKKRDTIYIK